MITVDNGPKFIGKALDVWAHRHGLKLVFNRPGKPVDNRYIESFNGRLRDECLNVNWFLSLKYAREVIGEWWEDYNSIRPHSSERISGSANRVLPKGSGWLIGGMSK